MVRFLHLEKRNAGAVAVNGTVLFNVELQSGGGITYDTGTGVITFSTPGVYYLNWFVAQQTGLATDGSNFAVVVAPNTQYVGSNHVKISQTSGFAIIETTQANVNARLVNVANAPATLSDTTQVKAAIAVFGISSDSSDTRLGYLQAQVGAMVLLGTDDPVDFDVEISRDPLDIVTQSGTEFVLANPGTYLVTWEIPIDATDTKDFANITLLLNGVTHSTAHVTLPIGVLSGSAMIVSQDTDGTLEFINTTDDPVRITEKANIVITQITRFAPPPPIAGQLDVEGIIEPGLLDIGGEMVNFSLV